MSILASLAAEFVSYYKAILSRSMFSMHALVAVWRTTVIMGAVYWSLVIGVVMLVVEYFVTMWVRMGEEWPWISPSTLCYLTTAAAALWVQKLESLGHIQGTNGTYVATLPSTGMKMDFSAADWLLLTEQTMMVTIILSRWLLPKGAMSHKDLSSLLLLYLALSADILDFSTIFNEATVVRDKTFCYVILVVWTGSLVQFVLVLTNTATVDKEDARITLKSIVCSSEIWQILVQIGLQDLPFLFVRLIALVQYKVFNFTIIFFVCKNSLVICLELYHLLATCVEQQRKMKKRKERMKHLKSKMVSVKKVVGLSKLHNITKVLKGGGDTDGKQENDDGERGTGNVKTTAQTNALSLFAAKLSKSKLEEAGKEKQEGVEDNNENQRVEDENERPVENEDNKIIPTQNKTELSAVDDANTNAENAPIQTKPVTQSLLLSAIKKQGLKNVEFSSDKGLVAKEPKAEDVARSGSELAGENNNWLDENPIWQVSTGNVTNKSEDEKDHKISDVFRTLSKQSSTLSIPPLSHLQLIQDRRERTSGSLQIIEGNTEPRDSKTRRSLFDEDDSVF